MYALSRLNLSWVSTCDRLEMGIYEWKYVYDSRIVHPWMKKSSWLEANAFYGATGLCRPFLLIDDELLLLCLLGRCSIGVCGLGVTRWCRNDFINLYEVGHLATYVPV